MRKLAWIVVVLGSLVLGGCGGDDGSEFTAGGGTGGSTGGTGGSAGGLGGTAGLAGGGAAGVSGSGATAGSSGAGGTAGTGGAAGAGGSGCPGSAPGCVYDYAGQFGQQGSADGVGTQARFQGMTDITGDGKYLWVPANNALRRIEIATATVTTVATGFGAVSGAATNGTTVWVVDTGNQVIRAHDIASGSTVIIAGSSGQSGTADGTGATARFDGPRGIAYDGQYLYVSEAANHSVRRVDPAGGGADSGIVTTIAGKNGTGSQNGTGAVAQFASPRNLDAFAGTVFVGDTENHQIRQIVLGGGGPATHTVTTVVGAGAGHADGSGAAALFNRLRGLDHDGSSILYVADSDNFVLRKVTVPGFVVTTIAGTPGNKAHAEGIGAAAAFDKPMDVHFDPGTADLFIVEGTVIRRMVKP